MKSLHSTHQPVRRALPPGIFRTGLTVLAAGMMLAVACERPGKHEPSARNDVPAAEVDSGPAMAGQEIRIPVAPSIASFLENAPGKALPFKTVGSQRILVELATMPEAAAAYAKKYDELVSAALSAVLRGVGSTPMSEETFILAVRQVMLSGLHVGYDPTTFHYLAESLQSGRFDCQNSSFLVFDIAKELGIQASLVSVPQHLFVKTAYFYLETTTWKYYPMESMHDEYPVIYSITTDTGKIKAGAYCNRGHLYRASRMFREAIQDYDTAIALNPEEPQFHDNRGVAYCDLGDISQGIADFDTAIRMNPKDPDFHFNLGKAYGDVGDADRALKEFNTAITLDPKDPRPYNSRGCIWADRKQYQRALKDMNKAIALDPMDQKDADFYNCRGSVYGQLKNPRRAIIDFTTAISLNPLDSIFYRNRAIAYRALGMEDSVRADMLQYSVLKQTGKLGRVRR